MTPQQIEAMKLALEALYPIAHNTTDDPRGQAYKAITALEEVLAQPEQEPVAWMDSDGNVSDNNDHNCFPIPLYTAPPQQEPVIDKSAAIRIATSLGWTPQRKPLTDEQIMANDVLRYHFALNGGAGPISKKGRKVIDAIEAAHGIKENT